MLPKKNLDRFIIIRQLGKGLQGVVYLAQDTVLHRHVAIKTFKKSLQIDRRHCEQLLREAQTIGKLQHPNIEAVYEIGDHGGEPYLVLEYVDGVPLAALMKRSKGIQPKRAVELIIQVLGGIAYAHEHSVIHRDLTPSNIMVTRGGIPKIVDFGISVIAGMQEDFAGTPRYVSPEHVSGSPLVPQSDIFSIGLIFYELLVGRHPFDADHNVAVMYKIAHEPVLAPSSANAAIDRKIEGIVMKALEKDLALRYDRALEMKKDLEEYLESLKFQKTFEPRPINKHSTVEFLLRRMSHKKDFPSLSSNLLEINQHLSPSPKNPISITGLSNIILRDPALTAKLLRLANSVSYGQRTKKITTVSRAVLVLGFEEVRLMTVSLMLFDHMQNKSQRADLKDAAISSFVSALVARDLARIAGLKHVEEVFVCSMLFDLGKQLTIFYFPEEYELINKKLAREEPNEEKASIKVLGISYGELAMAVLRYWNFPEKIVSSLQRLPEGEVSTPKSDTDWLNILSNFCGEVCRIIGSLEGDKRDAFIALTRRFRKAIPLGEDQLPEVMDSVRSLIEQHSSLLNIDPGRSSFVQQLAQYCDSNNEECSPQQDVSADHIVDESTVLQEPAEQSDSVGSYGENVDGSGYPGTCDLGEASSFRKAFARLRSIATRIYSASDR